MRITTNEAAEILGLKPATLAKWRTTGSQPTLSFIRRGKKVYYERDQVEAFSLSYETIIGPESAQG